MVVFIIKRLLGLLLTLFLVITISFIVIRLAPGNPFAGERLLSPEIMENVLRAYNLHQPLYVQYFDYLFNVLKLDFGPSFKIKDFSVGELLALGLPISISIGFSVIIISIVIAFIFGSIAALYHYKKTDYTIVSIAIVLDSIPGFVIAPVLVLVCAVYFKILPVSGWFGFNYTILPIISMVIPLASFLTRIVRNSMLEVLSSNYIRTAYAKGLSKQDILLKHAFKATALPVISVLGPITAFTLTGSFIIESIFNIPGIGRYLVQASTNRDYSLLMGCVIVGSTLILVINLLVDLAYNWLDPRINTSK